MKNSKKKIGAQHKVAAAAGGSDDGGAGASANSQPALPPPQAPAAHLQPVEHLQMIMPQMDSPMVMDPPAPIGASSFAQLCTDFSDFEDLVLDAPALDAPPPPLTIGPATAAPAASPPTPTTQLTLQRVALHECNFEESVMSELSASDDNVYVLGCEGVAFAVKKHCDPVFELLDVSITDLSVTETASAFAAFFHEIFTGRHEARIVVAPLALGGKDLRVHGFVAILGAKRTVGEEGESGIAALVSSAELSKLRQAVDNISGGGGIVYFNNQIAYAPPPTL